MWGAQYDHGTPKGLTERKVAEQARAQCHALFAYQHGVAVYDAGELEARNIEYADLGPCSWWR
jgi:hypothetical protein